MMNGGNAVRSLPPRAVPIRLAPMRMDDLGLYVALAYVRPSRRYGLVYGD